MLSLIHIFEWKNDHYYLIGFSLKHQKIAHFRVDRLTSIENLDVYKRHVAKQVKDDSASVDLREFIRDELDGCLFSVPVSYTHLDVYKRQLIGLPPVAAMADAISAVGWAHFSVSYPVRPTVSRKCMDSQNKFLSRTYLADETKRQINGQALGISSEVGIKICSQLPVYLLRGGHRLRNLWSHQDF